MRNPRERLRRSGPAVFAVCAAGIAVASGVWGTEYWTSYYDAGGADYATGVALDHAGAVVSVGQSAASPGTDGFVERRLAAGTFDWRRILDNPATAGLPSASNDYFTSVCVDPSDDVIAAGIVSGDFNDPLQGYWSAALVRKYGVDGSLLWEWKGNSEYGAWSAARAVATDPAGNVYAAGNVFGGWGAAEHQWAIWKIDPTGVLQNGYPIYYDYSPSADYQDIAWAIAVDPDGSFVVAGQRGAGAGTDANHRNLDWHVRRYSANGTLVWEDTVLLMRHLNEVAYAVALDADGDAYVAGCMNSGTDNAGGADWDALVVKYEKDTGQRVWAHDTSSDAGRNARYYAVAATPADTVTCAGEWSTIGVPPTGPFTEMLDANDASVIASEATAVSVNVGLSSLSGRDDLLALGGFATGPTTVEALSSLVRLASPPNREPWIDEDPWADTTLAAIGEPVGFHIRTHDPDGDPVTVHWEFGNAPSADGLDVQHAFTPSAGSFDVVATVSAGAHVVQPSMTVHVGEPFRSPSLRADLDFRRRRRDVISLSCKMQLPAGFDVARRFVQFHVGGVERTFRLNSRGRASTKDGTVALTYQKASKLWSLSVKLARGDYAAAWADEGLTNGNVKNRHVTMKASVDLGGAVRCAHLVHEVYNAKRGNWGRLR